MPLRYVDPHRKQSRIYRADMRFGRTRAGRMGWPPYKSANRPIVVYRKTRGRYPASLPVITSAPLVTTGAKTGQPREVQARPTSTMEAIRF